MICRICGNDKNNKPYKVKERMFGDNEIFDYFECSKCYCLQISEIPQNISKYYPSNYYSFGDTRVSYLDKIEEFMARKRDKYSLTDNGFLGLFLNMLYPSDIMESLKKIQLSKSMKILDVGCGDGNLLKSLRNIGFNKLKGVDPYIEKDIRYSNGLEIVKKQIYELDEEFDLIMFNHSFEHIRDPEKTLNSVYKLLSEEGTCLIRIPTVSSYAWKKYRINWVQLDAPRHLFLYSIESIKMLIQNSQFDLSEYYYDSTAFQFWGSEQYLREIPLNSSKSYLKNPTKSIFSKKEIELFKKMAVDLNKKNQGDQIVLYLKKQTKIYEN